MEKELIIKGNKHIIKYSEEDSELFNNNNVSGFEQVKDGAVIYYSLRFSSKELLGKKIARVVLGITDPNILADHINGDVFDNRRENLRAVTREQNAINKSYDKNTYCLLKINKKAKLFTALIPEGVVSFSNNYDAIIHIYNHVISTGRINYMRDKRTLVEVAEDIPYQYYEKEVVHNTSGHCDKCDTFIGSRFDLHYSKCTNLICPDCDSVFTRQSLIKRHMKDNCFKKICLYCKESFKNTEALRAHSCVIKCIIPGCDKTYLNPNSMRKHVVINHYDGDKSKWVPLEKQDAKNKVKCPECENTYSSKDTMMQHFKKKHS